VAKESLDENLEKTEEYPPQGLANRITKQHEEQQQRKWEQTDSEIRNRKQQKTRRNFTSEMKTRRQVITEPLMHKSATTNLPILLHKTHNRPYHMEL
jgi:archaellum component FlaD/FlaE